MTNSQFEAVKQCYKTIDDIFREVGVQDPATLYLCTNYVDTRLGYLMIYFNEHKIDYTPDQKTRIATCLKMFLDNLDKNDTYFLPRSGTYELKVPKSTLLQVLEVMQN
jgi:hypothetical protein